MLYKLKLVNKAVEAARRICFAFRGTSVSERAAKMWFSRFSSEAESLKDKPLVGHLSTLDKVQLEEEIEQNPCETCQELGHRFGAFDETI